MPRLTSKGLVEAAVVMFLDCKDIADCGLRSERLNPEEQLIVKDNFHHLSDEAKLVMSVIMKLPQEIVTNTGKVLAKHLNKYLKLRYGMSAKRVACARAEIACALR